MLLKSVDTTPSGDVIRIGKTAIASTKDPTENRCTNAISPVETYTISFCRYEIIENNFTFYFNKLF